MKSFFSICMAVAILGIAKAAEPQRPNPPVDVAKAKNRQPWQTDLTELFRFLQDVARKGSTPDQQYFVDGILRGTNSRAIPVLHPYAEHGQSKFFNGYADLTPKNGTVQWNVNKALKGRSVDWEFEVAKTRVMTAGKTGSGRESEKRFLELVPSYDDGGDQFSLKQPITRISTIRIEIPEGQSTQPELIAGDCVHVEGTIGDYATNQGVELNNFTGPIVVYKRKRNEDVLQTTISIGLRDAKLRTKEALPTLRIRQLASVPTRDKDAFSHARVAVSVDQKAVLSRNYIVSGGQDVRGRVRAYLWSLDPDNPKRTQLPDSTTFGFVPNSNLAYQVHWAEGILFWNTHTHTTSGAYIPHELREDTTMGPAISPSGKLMVTRSQLNRLRFWNIETRKPISKELKQAGIVYLMGFSSDGKWFFSQSHKKLMIWDPKTATLVSERLRQDISGFPYLSNTNQLVTVEHDKDKESTWRSELVLRSGNTFAESGRVRLSGRAGKAIWVDESHLLVVASNDNPDHKTPSSDGRQLLYHVSLGGEKPEIRTLMRHDWIRRVTVAPDHKHFIVRTRDETSCWKIGQEKPIWTKSGDHLVSFGDNDWVLLHNGPVIAYSLADGRMLWRKENVGIARVIGSSIWTCNENEMQIWRVDTETRPKKIRPVRLRD